MSRESATTVAELRQKLRSQGLATAREAVLAEGMDGTEDAGIFFPDATGHVHVVGFRTADISAETALGIIDELTVLVRQLPRKVGPRQRTLTFYFERR